MKQMALRTEMSENVVPPRSLANIPRGQPQERPGDPVTYVAEYRHGSILEVMGDAFTIGA